jgi:uncharacterized protein YjbJ (UPF0337 family)
MNQDILEGQWKQMHGQMREWWGKLTDNDLDRVQGNTEKLVGLLQEKYGYTRVQAEEEVNRRLNEYKMQHPTRPQSTDRQQGEQKHSM